MITLNELTDFSVAPLLRNDSFIIFVWNTITMRQHNYYVYIITNKNKTVLYTGVTNDLKRRLFEHKNGLSPGFTKKYNCHFILYYEHFTYIKHAIDREKEIKRWRREKKDRLITKFNPEWKFLNEEIYEDF